MRPSVILATLATSPVNNSPIAITGTLSEGVVSFTAANITASNANVSNFQMLTSTTFSFDLVPTSNGITVTAQVLTNALHDAANNGNTASNTISLVYDSILPIITLSTVTPADTNTSPFLISATSNKPLTGFSSSDITATGGTVSAFSGSGDTYSFTVTPTANGTVTISVPSGAASDASGNITSASNTLTIRYDTVAPTLALTAPASGTYINLANQSALSVSGTCSEAGRNVVITAGSVTQNIACTGTSYSGTLDLSSLSDGAITLSANLSDAAGNAATTASASLTKDTATPVLTFSGQPSGPSNQTTLNITVGGSAVASYYFKIGTTGVIDCTNSGGYSANTALATHITNSISALADGSVTLCGVGQSAGGNRQAFASATSFTWTKDTTVTPFSGLAIVPATPGNSTTPAIQGTSEANATLSFYSAAACAGTVLGTSSANGAGTFSVAPSASIGANGSYTFSVLATDAAGNTRCSANVPYVLDTSAPTVVLATTSGAYSKLSSIPVTVTFSESVTGFTATSLTLTNSTVANFTGSGASYSFDLAPSAQGTFSASVAANRAQDSALNYNTASNTISVVYDSIAPAFTIASPADNSGTAVVNNTFTGACENGLYITLSGTGLSSPANSPSACSGGTYSFTVTFTSGDGVKNVVLRQTDLAGNFTSITRAITVDSVAPTMAFTSAAVQNQLTNTNTATFSGSCETGAPITVAGGTDSSSSVACTGSTWSYTTNSQTTDGTRTYTFRQTDIAGNVSNLLTGTWQRDATPPGLTRTAPADGTRAQTQVTITGACETGLVINFSGSGILSPLSPTCAGSAYSQTVYFSNGEGTKLISVSQTDPAGNTATINTSFVRDNTPPALTQTVASPSWTKFNNTTFSGACETGLTIYVKRDGVAENSFACAAGTWSYTVANQTTDATRTYEFTQTDAAGNATTVTAQWVRRTTNPPLAFTSASSFTAASATYTFSGTCMTGVTIQVSGADTNSTTCGGGTWSYTTNSHSDGSYTINFTQTDLATNSTTITGTFTRDSTAPSLTLSTTTPVISNTGAQTFTGGCTDGLAINISGAQTTSTTCSSGIWSWTANQGGDGTYNYSFQQTNGLGTSTTVNAAWTLDTGLPTVSGLTINGGNASTSLSYAKVSFSGSDSFTKVNQFCLKQDNAQPLLGDSCWVAVNATPPGLTPALTFNMSNYSYYLGITPGTYTVYGWVRDEAGNINASPSSASIFYQVVPPPVIDTTFATNTASPSFPVPAAQLSVGAGGTVYIKWRASAGAALPASPITISFSTDDSNYTVISSSLANGANGGCTLSTSAADSAVTGCYNWSAPTSSFIRIKVEVRDVDGRRTSAVLPALNTGTFNLVAGNTNSGVGASTLSSLYSFRRSSMGWAEVNSFAISTTGVVYINDYNLGIVSVDPSDGLTKVLIPKTGVSSGDGALSTATVRDVLGITLDYQDRLLIWDTDRIRRVDFQTNNITRIIGGGTGSDTTGTSTSDSITDARNMAVEGYNPFPSLLDTEFTWRALRGQMIPLPNGDLYFGSNLGPWVDVGSKFRRYRESAGTQITRFIPGGTGHTGGAVPLTNCGFHTWGLDFNPANSNINFVDITAFEHGDAPSTMCNTTGTKLPPGGMSVYETLLDSNWQAVAAQPANSEVAYGWESFVRITGRNGKLYAIRRGGPKGYKFNSATKTWTQFLGTGNWGTCADGTLATSCNMDLMDLWVTAQGQVFFLDGGVIRTLDSANKVVTLFGQPRSGGDGGKPQEARFSNISAVAAENDGRVLLYDFASIREVSADRSLLSKIAGGSSYGWAGDGNTAATTNMYRNIDYYKNTLILDPVNNDIFFTVRSPNNRGAMGRIRRSDGIWEALFGYGTGQKYYEAGADGTPGTLLQLGVMWEGSEWGDGMVPLGFGGGKLAIGLSKYPQPGYPWTKGAIKLYDSTDSWRQSNLITSQGNESGPNYGPNGSDVTNTQVPVMYQRSKLQYDSVDRKWMGIPSRGDVGNNATAIRTFIEATTSPAAPGSIGTLVNLPRTINNFVYNRAGHEYVYYCSYTGYLYRYDITAGTEMQINMPSPAMRCLPQNTIDLDRTNNILYFGFQQNGLHAVGSISGI